MNRSLFINKIDDMVSKLLNDRDIYLETVDKLDYFKTMVKAEKHGVLYTVSGMNMFGFNVGKDKKDLFLIFAIPINEEIIKLTGSRSRHVSDITLSVLDVVENYFVYIDKVIFDDENIENDRSVYFCIIKKNFERKWNAGK